MEHMMKQMERYAANLEEIVDERTSQLEEQKRRSDELLAAMLPKYADHQNIPKFRCDRFGN